MIERCTFCGNTHETGDPNETFFGGMRMRICPEVPDPPGFIMFNSRDWIPPGTRLTDLFPSGLNWPLFRNLVPLSDMLDKYPGKTVSPATVAAAPRPTLSRPGILDTAKPPIL